MTEGTRKPRIGVVSGPPNIAAESADVGCTDGLLTANEHALVAKLGECFNLFGKTMDELHGEDWRHTPGFSNPGYGDAVEFAQAVHVCQNIVLSRAAARAFPNRYRP